MIGVIADDFTGAAEVGAIGSLHGLDSEVVLGPDIESGADLVCIDTDSRSCAGPEAANRAAMAARSFRAAGAQWIYKKIDSVLRGPVLPEIDSILKVLALPRALVAPGNPGLGRVVQGGKYYVRGQPINETHFRYDPEYPRKSADVLDLLGDSAAETAHVCKVNERLPQSGIVIGEVANTADLDYWAARCDEATSLPAGGAEFFSALLKVQGRQALRDVAAEVRRRVRSEERRPCKGSYQLFICGSASPATRDFVRQMRDRGVPVIPASCDGPHGASTSNPPQTVAEAAAMAWRENRRLVIAVSPSLFEPTPFTTSLDRLADLACALLADRRDAQVYAEGGATAVRVARRLGWHQLRIVCQLSPGVVVLRPLKKADSHFVVKPGSYSWPAGIQGAVSDQIELQSLPSD